MTEIIKQGNKIKKFKCPICKCKFKTDEYKIKDGIVDIMFTIDCPNCKVIFDEPLTRW